MQKRECGTQSGLGCQAGQHFRHPGMYSIRTPYIFPQLCADCRACLTNPIVLSFDVTVIRPRFVFFFSLSLRLLPQAAHCVLQLQDTGRAIHKVKTITLNAMCENYNLPSNPFKGETLSSVYSPFFFYGHIVADTLSSTLPVRLWSAPLPFRAIDCVRFVRVHLQLRCSVCGGPKKRAPCGLRAVG